MIIKLLDKMIDLSTYLTTIFGISAPWLHLRNNIQCAKVSEQEAGLAFFGGAAAGTLANNYFKLDKNKYFRAASTWAVLTGAGAVSGMLSVNILLTTNNGLPREEKNQAYTDYSRIGAGLGTLGALGIYTAKNYYENIQHAKVREK